MAPSEPLVSLSDRHEGRKVHVGINIQRMQESCSELCGSSLTESYSDVLRRDRTDRIGLSFPASCNLQERRAV